MSENREQPTEKKGKKMSMVASFREKYSQSNNQAMRNPWVLGLFGMLGLFLTVNFVFIFFAFWTSPGLVTEDYYEQGRKYEENAIKLLAAKNNLQWTTNIEIPRDLYMHKVETVRFNAVDSRGIPIEGADVSVTAYRPSDASADFMVKLDNFAPGIYQTNIAFPLKGIWDLKLRVARGEEALEMEHRISVKAQ